MKVVVSAGGQYTQVRPHSADFAERPPCQILHEFQRQFRMEKTVLTRHQTNTISIMTTVICRFARHTRGKQTQRDNGCQATHPSVDKSPCTATAACEAEFMCHRGNEHKQQRRHKQIGVFLQLRIYCACVQRSTDPRIHRIPPGEVDLKAQEYGKHVAVVPLRIHAQQRDGEKRKRH